MYKHTFADIEAGRRLFGLLPALLLLVLVIPSQSFVAISILPKPPAAMSE